MLYFTYVKNKYNLQKIKKCSLLYNSNFIVLDKKIKNNKMYTIFLIGVRKC